jgi:SAM-dependent methyltransferase
MQKVVGSNPISRLSEARSSSGLSRSRLTAMKSVGPNVPRARRRYDRIAGRYDLSTRLLAPARRRAIEALRIEAGATVLDVACGTGLNLEPLQRAVGGRGRVIGVDISPGMLAVARARKERAGWANVDLLEADVARADLPPVNAALFSFTHDVLQTPAAVRGVAASLGPGARVAATGVKYAHRAASPVNAAVRLIAPRFITTRDGLREPWKLLSQHVGPLVVQPMLLGTLYVASGPLAGAPAAPRPPGT